MAIAAKLVLGQAADILQDPTNIRWTANELVRWLNAGQREVMLHRPDAFNKTAVLACAPGTKQALPADGVKLIDVQRNTAGTRRAVRLCNREILDAQIPNWHGLTGSTEILHFMFDEREPTAFWVYPPAMTGASVEINYSANPADIVEPGAGKLVADVMGNIDVKDVYSNALLDYVLYRAYLKDSEYAGNAERAIAHYTVFGNALGLELKATVAIAPRSRGNPNVAREQAQ